MQLKLYLYWLSLLDLLQGRMPFVYEVTFILGMINTIIGCSVAFTSMMLIHILLGVVISLVGVFGVVTAIVPFPHLRSKVDLIGLAAILYGAIRLYYNGGYKQMAYSFVVIYILFYVWKFMLEKCYAGTARSTRLVK